MRAKYVSEIEAIVDTLDENQVLYLLTFLKKLFGEEKQ